MPVYEYLARDAAGTETEGTVEARSKGEALVLLRRKNLWVHRIDEFGAAPAPRPTGWGASPFYVLWPITPGALAAFFEQLGQLLRAGIGPHAVFSELAGRASGPRLRSICRQGAQALASGGSISTHLARYPRVFQPHVLAMMRAGELTGELAPACAQIAEQFELEARVRRLIFWTRLYYGTVLVLAAWALMVLIPGLGPFFERLKETVAGLSRGEIVGALLRQWAHDTLYKFLPWVLLVWVTLKVLTVVINLEALRGFRDRLLLVIPLVAGPTRRSAVARFSRALAALYQAGVPLPDALQQSAAAAGNRVIAARLAAGAPMLGKGTPLSTVLGAAGLLSGQDLARLATGEQAGMLDQTLDRLATETEQRRQSTIRTTMFAGPIIVMVLVAVLVAFAVIRFWLWFYGDLVMSFGEE